MPTEKEVKDAARKRRYGIAQGMCSISSRPCECESGNGCRPNKPKLDSVPIKDVRALQTARIYLEAAKGRLDDVQDEYMRTRKFPGPEVREVRLKLVTAQSMIDEIIADSLL